LALQPGYTPRLAAAAGKNGKMYFMNCDNLGGYAHGGPDKVSFIRRRWSLLSNGDKPAPVDARFSLASLGRGVPEQTHYIG